MRLADHFRAGVEQALHRRSGPRRCRVRGEPFRTAEAGAVAGDIEDVLDAEREARKRAGAGAFHRNVGVPAKRAEVVAMKNRIHFLSFP
ncbi:hypothetical protein D3C83_28100 [compost metagenome]